MFQFIAVSVGKMYVYLLSYRFDVVLTHVKFIMDITLGLIAVYDATSLTSSVPGLGHRETSLLGVNLTKAYPVLLIRLLLWFVLSVIVAETAWYHSLSILLATGVYAFCVFVGTSVSLCCHVVEMQQDRV